MFEYERRRRRKCTFVISFCTSCRYVSIECGLYDTVCQSLIIMPRTYLACGIKKRRMGASRGWITAIYLLGTIKNRENPLSWNWNAKKDDMTTTMMMMIALHSSSREDVRCRNKKKLISFDRLIYLFLPGPLQLVYTMLCTLPKKEMIVIWLWY